MLLFWNMNTQTEREKILADHVHTEHKQTPFENYFKEVIYGGIDGIITTFAVVAGFSGAAFSNETTTQLSFLVVLLFGLANLFADGVSMGLGNFLSVKSDQDLYKSARRKEEKEVKENPQFEFDETVTILMKKGYSAEDAHAMALLYQKNESYWVDFMMVYELEMTNPTGTNAMFTGLATFVSFLVFGAIPLLPFMLGLSADRDTIFIYSIIGTCIALVLLGLLKWKVAGSHLWKSLFEVVIVGGSAALVAFMVGSFFKI